MERRSERYDEVRYISLGPVSTAAKALLLTASTMMFLAVLIAATQQPAEGYELSIYRALPNWFWVLLIGSIIINVGLIIWNSFTEHSQVWKYSMMLIVICYSTLFLLPQIRGYVLYGRGSGDVLVHIGLAKEIIATAHVSSDDLYPVTHILISSLSIANLRLEVLAMITSTFILTLFIVSIVALIGVVTRSRKAKILALFLASPLVFGNLQLALMPSILSASLIPMILWTIHKGGKETNPTIMRVITIVLLLLMVLFHPMTAAITIVILFTFMTLRFVRSRISSSDERGASINPGMAAVMVLVALSGWTITSSRALELIRRAVDSVFFGTGRSSVIEYHIGVARLADLDLIRSVETTVLLYGPAMAFIIMSIFSLRVVLRRRRAPVEFSYGVQFIVGLIFSMMFLFVYLLEYEPMRIVRYPLIVGMIVSSLAFYRVSISRRSISRVTGLALGTVVVLSSCVIGVLGAYGSPAVFQSNAQLTHMESEGIAWYLEERDLNIPLLATSFQLYKYECYYYGGYQTENKGIQIKQSIPSHFGDCTLRTMADELGVKSLYMTVTEVNKQYHLAYPESAWPLLDLYLDSDLDKLNSDMTAIKIFDNGEFETWHCP